MKINSREELNHLQEYYSSRLNAQKKKNSGMRRHRLCRRRFPSDI